MDKSSRITLIILGLIIVAALTVLFLVQRGNSDESLQSSPAATAFSPETPYTDIDGDPIVLSDYVGQSVVVFAWASWCPDCVNQLRVLSDYAKSREDVVVLAINRAESPQTAKNFLQHFGLIDTVDLVLDPNDHFFNSVNGYTMPETVIFNEQGLIVHHERGPITKEEIDLWLRS